MKHLLCFGDSNTHGYIPGGGRYDDNTRWPRLLARNLGEDFLVYEEGLNGRTSSMEDPFKPYKNAMDYIVPCLMTHEPLDLTILMLGSNDMKQYFSPSIEKITKSLHSLTKLILDVSGAPVLLISPIHLGDKMAQSPFADSFPPASVSLSHQLGTALSTVAEQLGAYFLDASAITEPSPEDSLHLAAEGHRRLADAITKKVRQIIL